MLRFHSPLAAITATDYTVQVWAAIGMLVFIYLVWAVASRKLNPLWLAVGFDGKLSTSKFQFLMWTAATIFTFAVLAASRQGAVLSEAVPQYLLIAMGLTLSTTVAAKGITTAYVNSGRVAKDPGNTPTLNLAYLVCDDDGSPDLTKVQMLAWTFVAIATFLFNLSTHFSDYALCNFLVGTTKLCYPDIDSSLMALMGLGQGTYLGFKLAENSAAAPALTGAAATRDPQTQNVTVQISGSGLNGAVVSLDGEQLQAPVAWTDSGGSFLLPAVVNQTTATPGRPISLAVNLNGQILGPCSFTVP